MQLGHGYRYLSIGGDDLQIKGSLSEPQWRPGLQLGCLYLI